MDCAWQTCRLLRLLLPPQEGGGGTNALAGGVDRLLNGWLLG